jgi:hypothetical protein
MKEINFELGRLHDLVIALTAENKELKDGVQKLSEEFMTVDSHYGWWFSDKLDELIEGLNKEK